MITKTSCCPTCEAEFIEWYPVNKEVGSLSAVIPLCPFCDDDE